LATIEPKGGHHVVEMIRLLKGNKDSATNSLTRATNQIIAILVTAPALLPVKHSVLLLSAALLLQIENVITDFPEYLDQLNQQTCSGFTQDLWQCLMLPTASRSLRLGTLYVV